MNRLLIKSYGMRTQNKNIKLSDKAAYKTYYRQFEHQKTKATNILKIIFPIWDNMIGLNWRYQNRSKSTCQFSSRPANAKGQRAYPHRTKASTWSLPATPAPAKPLSRVLISQIYKSMGILTEGQFVETDRSGLVAAYLGQTAIKTRKVVESALAASSS